MSTVDYKIIGEAVEFYKRRGYEYIEVPWSVPREVAEITAPEDALLFPFRDEVLLASGEQSFLKMLEEGLLEEGKRYVCVTPCFRDEKEYNKYTLPYFMKVELIITGSEDDNDVLAVLLNAAAFFGRYLPNKVEFLRMDEGIDIMYNGVELGSYGARSHETTGPWVYGTGVAEPRFSQVLAGIPKGYSLNNIPRGEFGDVSKIQEEVEELQDAIDQDARIMALVELSDMYGAIEGFIERNFPEITMEDIKKMSKITGRAFRHGYR